MTLLKDWQYEHMLELGVTNFVRSVQHDNSSQQHIYIGKKKLGKQNAQSSPFLVFLGIFYKFLM